MVYTKSIEWAHEREWRIYMGDGRDKEALYEDIPFDPRELDAVMVGCRMPQNDRTAFYDSARSLYPHAEVLRMEPSGKHFQLNMKPLEP